MSEFIYSEQSIADQTGIPKRSLQTVRTEKLPQKSAWDIVGAAVAYSESGLQTLLALVGLKNAADAEHPDGAALRKNALLVKPDASAPANPDASEKKSAVLMARVMRWPLNRHILICRMDDASTIQVWVQTRDHLRVGVTIPVIKPVSGSPFYTVNGRLPSRSGQKIKPRS